MIKNGVSVYDVIKFVRSTEKASILKESGVITFSVDPRSDKKMIKRAVKDIFEVDALSVRIINTAERSRTFRGKKGKRSGFKKALVNIGNAKINFIKMS